MDAPDDYTLADLPDALRHILPRQAPADEAFDAAFLAAAVSGRGERGGLFPAAAAESHRGTGGDDLCAGARGDGRGGDRRDARGQCPDDGYIQPRVQHGDRARGARRSVAGRDGGMLLHADTGAYRAAAHHALRGCAVLPFRTARSGEMDRGSQSDFILHVARIAGGDHRPYDGLYPRFARCFARDRAVAGIRGAGNLPGAVQGRPLARPPLRRRSGGRAVARAEKHGAGRLDGAVVPRPDLLDRPDGIYCLAELRQFLPDMEKGQRKSNKLIVKN